MAKSNDYYRKIHPAEAAEVDARFAAEKAKAEPKAKATPATKCVFQLLHGARPSVLTMSVSGGSQPPVTHELKLT